MLASGRRADDQRKYFYPATAIIPIKILLEQGGGGIVIIREALGDGAERKQLDLERISGLVEWRDSRAVLSAASPSGEILGIPAHVLMCLSHIFGEKNRCM